MVWDSGKANGLSLASSRGNFDIGRLCASMQRSRLALRRFRQEKREAVRQYVGAHYSDDGTKERVPVNLIAQYVAIVARSLVAKNPRVMFSSFDRTIRPTLSAMQAWANKKIEQMNVQDTLQRIVIDSLFSIGIAKVAIAAPAEAAAKGWGINAGEAFIDRVSLDDFCFDVNARSFDEATYIGHRFRVPLSVVQESKVYGKGRHKLTPTTIQPFNLEGDERARTISSGVWMTDQEEFEDHVDLWEVYLPRHRVILTLADDLLSGASAVPGSINEPLREQRWVGPDSGPYTVLGFDPVPDNAMYKGKVQDLIDLHEATNRTYRKMIRTIDRLKEVIGVRNGATEDGSTVIKANDGDIIRLDDPASVVPIVTSGQTMQTLVAIATELRQMFNMMGGNLELLGGMAPQSGTASQDKLLNQNAGLSMSDMQEKTITFTGKVFKNLGWFWWHDPIQVQQSKYALPGLPALQINRAVTPEDRAKGKYEDLDIQVDPYSLQHQTPQSRMANMNQVVTQVVIPMMQLMVQQGVNFDISAYLGKIAKWTDQPDLTEILSIIEPPAPETLSRGGEGPTKPQTSDRTYTRRNVSEGTASGQSRNTVASLLGKNQGGNNKNGR